MTRRRTDRQADAELTRPRADRKREHAGHAHHGDHQRHAGKPAEHQRVEAIGRQHLRAHVFKRGGTLHRLLRRQALDDSRDGRHQRIGVTRGVHEQPPAADLLLERVIHRHGRSRHHVLIVHVRRDADDAPAGGGDADELHHRIGPHEIAVHGVTRPEHPSRDALADDYDRRFVSAVRVREVATGDNRDAEGGKEPGRHGAEARTRVLLTVRLRVPLDPELEAGAEHAGITPRHRGADGHPFHARQFADAPHYLPVERARLLWRAFE